MLETRISAPSTCTPVASGGSLPSAGAVVPHRFSALPWLREMSPSRGPFGCGGSPA
jgi:hypothetical protein